MKIKFEIIIEFLAESLYSLVLNNRSKLAERIRRKILQTNCYIDTSVIITNKYNFTCGEGCAIYHGSYILNSSGKVTLGNSSHLASMCYLNVCHGNLVIGDDVAIGPGTKIIVYSNHYESAKKVTNVKITKDVVIENNVLIGANCTILPGTIIHDNVVIGANSVVKGDIKSNSIYAGIPVRRIKSDWYE